MIERQLNVQRTINIGTVLSGFIYEYGKGKVFGGTSEYNGILSVVKTDFPDIVFIAAYFDIIDNTSETASSVLEVVLPVMFHDREMGTGKRKGKFIFKIVIVIFEEIIQFSLR